jgi:hypothetical protein
LEIEIELQGFEAAYATERVAKPYEWDFPGVRQRFRDALQEAKKRALESEYA